jgi:drug/metabolite transporter superfamily protein YnfA
MRTLRGWIVMSWIMLPGVMVGGGVLLSRLTTGDADPFRATWIRAFHAHGGVLIMMSILYYEFLDRTMLSAWAKHAASLTLFVGIGAQVSGFLVHALTGQPGHESAGTAATLAGAALIALALIALVYGLIRAPRSITDDCV